MRYEYECEKCGVFEEIISLKNFTRTRPCPKCKGDARKIISGAAPQTFEPYFDRIQNKEFKTKRDFETYCRERNLYKPTQKEIKAHREEYADLGRKTSHGNAR